MQLGIFEILNKAAAIEDRVARINYLRKESNSSVHQLLRYALDPRVEWLVGPDIPEHHVGKGNPETIFMTETRRLYLFAKGGNDALTPHRREQLFIQLLEMLHPGDVEVMKYALQKRLPHANLDYALIAEAFPGLLPVNTTHFEGLRDNTPPSADVFKMRPSAADDEQTKRDERNARRRVRDAEKRKAKTTTP